MQRFKGIGHRKLHDDEDDEHEDEQKNGHLDEHDDDEIMCSVEENVTAQ